MKKIKNSHKMLTADENTGIKKICILISFGLLFAAPLSSSTAGETVITEESVPVKAIATEFIECFTVLESEGNQSVVNTGSAANKYQCLYYSRPDFIAILDNSKTPPQGGLPFNTLRKALDHAKVSPSNRYIFLHKDMLFEFISTEDIAALSEAFEAGSPVGTSSKSAEHALETALGLGESHNQLAGDTGGESVYFLHRRVVPASLLGPERKLVDHLEVGLEINQPYSTILGRVIDWQEKSLGLNKVEVAEKSVSGVEGATSSRAASLDPSTGWTLCKTYSYAGTVPNDDGNPGGAYAIDLSFYYTLGPEMDDGKDRWLVTADLTSAMSDYYNENGNKHKGWYMRSMSLNAELGQFLGDIEEWSPTTTVGSTSRTTSIGGSISATGSSSSGGSISWSASTTNSTEDVEVRVDGNTTNLDGVNGNDWVNWQVNFAKCQSNNLSTKLKQPAAAAQGLWKEPLALITANEDLNEGTKFTLIPQFKIEHCRCGSGSCPIRKANTYSPWGSTGRVFQVVVPESCN